MPQTVATGRDHEIAELPPNALGCGHPYGPGLVVIGYNPHPSGVGRCRTYWCRTCRLMTYCEPEAGRGAVALGR